MEHGNLFGDLPLHHTRLSTDAPSKEGQQAGTEWWTKVDAALMRGAKGSGDGSLIKPWEGNWTVVTAHLGVLETCLGRKIQFDAMSKSIRHAAHLMPSLQC